jgi:hypothetical protein
MQYFGLQFATLHIYLFIHCHRCTLEILQEVTSCSNEIETAEKYYLKLHLILVQQQD